MVWVITNVHQSSHHNLVVHCCLQTPRPITQQDLRTYWFNKKPVSFAAGVPLITGFLLASHIACLQLEQPKSQYASIHSHAVRTGLVHRLSAYTGLLDDILDAMRPVIDNCHLKPVLCSLQVGLPGYWQNAPDPHRYHLSAGMTSYHAPAWSAQHQLCAISDTATPSLLLIC